MIEVKGGTTPQEPTKNTVSGCLNNFSRNEIASKFYANDSVSKVCDKCPSLEYSEGIMTCTKI